MLKLFCDLGEGTSLPTRQIVLILDADTATRQAVTRNFLKVCNDKGRAMRPKGPLRQVNSLILTNSHGRDALYSSSRRSAALAGDCSTTEKG